MTDWSSGAGQVDTHAINTLKDAVAHLRALRIVAPRVEPGHGILPRRFEVELRFDPPPGQSVEEILRLRLGKTTPEGCLAATESAVYELPRAVCAALQAPLLR